MFFILLIFLSFTFASTNLRSILSLNDNIFYVTNEKLHNSLNNLFYLFKLNRNFSKIYNHQILLRMHSDCNDISEKIYKIYGTVSKISKEHFDNKKSYTVDKLYELVGDIFKENNIIHNNKEPKSEIQLANNNSIELEIENKLDNELLIPTKLNYNSNDSENSITHDYINISSEEEKLHYKNSRVFNSSQEFTGSNESLSFVNDFMSKINKLSIEDLTKSPTNKTVYLNTQTTYKIEDDPQFTKRWHPWISSEETHFTANRRIFHGKPTRIRIYSFVASIHISNEFICVGSIISRDLIISAASCLHVVYANKQSGHRVTVRVGSDYPTNLGQKRSVKEVLFHPKYNPYNLHNNLVILKTTKHIGLNSNKITKIHYDKIAGPMSEDVDVVTLLGWGDQSAKSAAKKNHRLSFAKLNLYNLETCREIYTGDYVSQTNFCAGFVTKGDGACNRDAGGPGIIKGLLAGVVSFGSPKCGEPDAPTVFTELGYYADWIDSVLNETNTEKQNDYDLRKQTALKQREQIPSIDRTVGHAMVTPSSVNENLFILREILMEMIRVNETIDNLLYNDLEEDFNEHMFKTTEPVDIFNHPLLNKSLFIYAQLEDVTTHTTISNVEGWIDLITTTPTSATEEMSYPNEPVINLDTTDIYNNNAFRLRFETMNPMLPAREGTTEMNPFLKRTLKYIKVKNGISHPKYNKHNNGFF